MNENRRGIRGFTLMEMLIVVAIIAVLVAIAVPVVNSQLERSREAVDEANSRSAMAVAAVGFMDGTLETGVTYYFDLSGSFVTAKPDAYGKGTEADGGMVFPDNSFGMTYDSGGDYTQSVIVARMEDGATYPIVKWDKVGISVGMAKSAGDVIQGLRISNFWSEASGMPKGDGTFSHQDDLDWRTKIEGALGSAGYDTSTFSYQKDNDDNNGIFITLNGKLEVDDAGDIVPVARYDTRTGEVTTGTATVVKGKFGRASVAVTTFKAD